MNNDLPRIKSILVVEDDVSQQALNTLILSPLAEKVDIAGDGKTALEQLQQHTYDLIILDLGLPDMNGLDVAKRYRKMSDQSTTPIIVVSAQAMTEDQRHTIIDMGINECVTKPITRDKLRPVWPNKDIS